MRKFLSFTAALILIFLCVSAPALAEGEAELPPWYPEDVEGFTLYHDAGAPRVVDSADIFSDAEEERIEARLSELRSELQKDIVIYTDVTSYGLGHEICAADFYDFNGYGIGDDFEGICLFVCMDPMDRGWWVCCTGPVTRGLYTADAADRLDDVLYEYMSRGDYAEGVEDWIENIRTLYVKGIPFAPDWWPDYGVNFTRFHNDTASRVVDDADCLSDAEVQALSAKAAEISRKYGIDIVVHTTNTTYGMAQSTYDSRFYEYNGYGFGDGYDGILLSVYPGWGYPVDITASGHGRDKLTDTNLERLYDRTSESIETGGYYNGISEYLKLVDHMERTGRVPRTAAYWAFSAVLSALFGSAFGGVSLGVAKSKMATPREKTDADAYITSGASKITDVGRRFLYTTSTRTYAPRQERSDSGSSSGSSGSHTSSYTGSSGQSHSGSGRKF